MSPFWTCFPYSTTPRLSTSPIFSPHPPSLSLVSPFLMTAVPSFLSPTTVKSSAYSPCVLSSESMISAEAGPQASSIMFTAPGMADGSLLARGTEPSISFPLILMVALPMSTATCPARSPIPNHDPSVFPLLPFSLTHSLTSFLKNKNKNKKATPSRPSKPSRPITSLVHGQIRPPTSPSSSSRIHLCQSSTSRKWSRLACF